MGAGEATGITLRQRLHLDHVGAEVTHHEGRVGAGHMACEIDDPDAGQRPQSLHGMTSVVVKGSLIVSKPAVTVNRAPGRTYDAAVSVTGATPAGPWKFEIEGAVALASYHRPPRNLMTFGDMEQLRPWLESVAANPAIGSVMLTSGVA